MNVWQIVSTAGYKRTIGVLAVLIIVAAVPLTVFISQKQQEVRQRAEGPSGETCSINVTRLAPNVAKVDYSGSSNVWTYVSVEKTNGEEVNGIDPVIFHLQPENRYPGHTYDISQCSGNCNSSVNINLPPGDYFISCAVSTRTEPIARCNGSPLCQQKGGSLNCQEPITPFCSSNDHVSFTSYTNSESPKGYLDAADCNNIGGWTCDENDYNAPLRVDFYANGPIGQGVGIGSVMANQQREEAVGNECGGNRNHGYTFTTPDSLKDGQNHTIYAYAINTPSGDNPLLTNSPRTINCSSGPALSASISGPNSGTVNQALSYTVTANGTNLTGVRIYSANANNDLTQASSWTITGQSGCSGNNCSTTASFTPPAAGQYSLVAWAGISSGYCSGNPATHNGSIPGETICGNSDNITLNVAPPTPLSVSISGPNSLVRGSTQTYTATTTDARVRTIEIYYNYGDTTTGRDYRKIAVCHSSPCTANLNTNDIPADKNSVWVLANGYTSECDDPLHDSSTCHPPDPAVSLATACTGNPNYPNTTPNGTNNWWSCGQNSNMNISVTTPALTPTSIPTPAPLPSATPPPSGLAADVNGDGCISMSDFNEWLYAYNHSGTPRNSSYRPDMNNDGTVNLLDYNVWYDKMRSRQNLCGS